MNALIFILKVLGIGCGLFVVFFAALGVRAFVVMLFEAHQRKVRIVGGFYFYELRRLTAAKWAFIGWRLFLEPAQVFFKIVAFYLKFFLRRLKAHFLIFARRQLTLKDDNLIFDQLYPVAKDGRRLVVG